VTNPAKGNRGTVTSRYRLEKRKGGGDTVGDKRKRDRKKRERNPWRDLDPLVAEGAA